MALYAFGGLGHIVVYCGPVGLDRLGPICL